MNLKSYAKMMTSHAKIMTSHAKRGTVTTIYDESKLKKGRLNANGFLIDLSHFSLVHSNKPSD